MYLTSIQALRAVAALAVLYLHTNIMLSYNAGYPAETISNAGAAGVDIFFVISGFVMLHVHHNQFGSFRLAGAFLLRRAIRIVPLYWTATLLIATGLLVVPGLFNVLKFDLVTVLKSLLFIPGPGPGGINVLHVAGWSLCIEVLFYLLFTVALLFPKKIGMAFIGFALTLLVAAGVVFSVAGTPLEIFMSPLLLEFAAGMLLALAWRRRWLLPAGLAWPVLVLAFLAIGMSGYLLIVQDSLARVFWWGIPAVLMVWGAVSLETEGRLKPPKILLRIGDSSYSLYLLHILVLPVLAKGWRLTGWHHHLPQSVALILFFGVTVAACYIAYRMFERPLTKALQARWRTGLPATV